MYQFTDAEGHKFLIAEDLVKMVTLPDRGKAFKDGKPLPPEARTMIHIPGQGGSKGMLIQESYTDVVEIVQPKRLGVKL